MCICKLCTLFVLICLDGIHQAALGDVYFQFDLGFVRIRQDRCVFGLMCKMHQGAVKLLS